MCVLCMNIYIYKTHFSLKYCTPTSVSTGNTSSKAAGPPNKTGDYILDTTSNKSNGTSSF